MPERSRPLHAPWRDVYLRAMAPGDVAEESSGAAPAGSSGCFLRDYWLSPEQDLDNHVVIRRTDDEAGGPGLGGIALLNLFPYSGGHLLVALGEGRARLLDYAPAQRSALWSLVEDALGALERAFAPQGVNIGINQGRAAGAGVPQHVHVHLVPRWVGDVNFMSVVGDVRVIPTGMRDTAARIRDAWEAVRAGGAVE